MLRYLICGVLVGFCVMAACQKAAHAEEVLAVSCGAASPAATVEPTRRAKLVLRRGLRERNLGLGYGFKIGLKQFEGRTSVPFFTVVPRFGTFHSPRREILLELPFTVFTRPDTRFALGTNLLFRQHVTRWGQVVPFVEIGLGGVVTNLRIRELGGSFFFAPQGGVGLRLVQSANSSFTLGLRWYHLSNAGLHERNRGLNNALVIAGYSTLY